MDEKYVGHGGLCSALKLLFHINVRSHDAVICKLVSLLTVVVQSFLCIDIFRQIGDRRPIGLGLGYLYTVIHVHTLRSLRAV